MAENLSGMPWTRWPVAGAVGAGRSDEMPELPEGFRLTPSGQVEQDGEEAVRSDGGSREPAPLDPPVADLPAES